MIEFNQGQLSIIVTIVLQTIVLAYVLGGFKRWTETKIEDHSDRLDRTEDRLDQFDRRREFRASGGS